LDFEKFQSEAIERLKRGEALLGKDGIMTPLLKQFLEKTLEGEIEYHLDEKAPNYNPIFGLTLFSWITHFLEYCLFSYSIQPIRTNWGHYNTVYLFTIAFLNWLKILLYHSCLWQVGSIKHILKLFSKRRNC